MIFIIITKKDEMQIRKLLSFYFFSKTEYVITTAVSPQDGTN